MGVYIGPYVSVRLPVIKLPQHFPWCETCNATKGNTKFCQDCGKEIVLRAKLFPDTTPHWSVPHTVVLRYAASKGYVDRDKFVDYVYVIGNGVTDFNDRQEDEEKLHSFWRGGHMSFSDAVVDLRDTKPDDEIKWLKHRCCAEIENISEVFGESNVSFGWGLVSTGR